MNSGFILINKPESWTSHDVIGYLRKIIGIKKIGHAGTLDPFATGLLIVGIGREATKRLGEFKILPKKYIATLKLGATSNTYDRTGEIVKSIKRPPEMDMSLSDKAKDITKKEIKKILKNFVGKQSQMPPVFSAKKVAGKKLCELARTGKPVECKEHKIEIFKIKLLDYNPKAGSLKLRVEVSSGTYIRTLAHDIGQKLGCGAYCEELGRTKIGRYSLKNARNPKDITGKNYNDFLI